MYLPKDFLEEDEKRLAALMAGNSFALLVTSDGEGLPFASHLPFLHEPQTGSKGRLLGHMARANPQWRHFENGAEVMVVFSGPHAYISPSWYATHPSVPTWNYAAVHVYGRPTLLDENQARVLIGRLVETYEAGSENPWLMDLPEKYERMMLRGIVAFEIAIDRLEGKFKLSQNRDAVDRDNVARQLEQAGFDDATGVAKLMRAREGDA